MSSTQAESHSRPADEELECKICCQRYDTQRRRPKVLPCGHGLCAHCLSSILGTAGTPQYLRCPFCRRDADVTLGQVAGLPDDFITIAQLATAEKCWPSDWRGLVFLSQGPSSSQAQDSPSCLLTTITDIQLSPGPDAVSISSSNPVEQDGSSHIGRHMPRILVWLLGFLYFGSLPLGIYMLVIQKVTLGIVCVSVVPYSLSVCLVYAFCRCLSRGTRICSARQR